MPARSAISTEGRNFVRQVIREVRRCEPIGAAARGQGCDLASSTSLLVGSLLTYRPG